MYICLDCGYVFDDGEERVWREKHGLETPPYEEFRGCPVCGGAYEETTQRCKDCDEFVLSENLYEGRCEKCLAETIGYINAYDFLCETGYMPQFIFEKFYKSSTPEKISVELMAAIQERFMRQKTDDQIKRKQDFLDLAREFILEDDVDGKEVYSAWLNRKERQDG